jgi:pilus assembly protein CpaE
MNDMAMVGFMQNQPSGGSSDGVRVGLGYFDGAFGRSPLIQTLTPLFPHVRFMDLAENWGNQTGSGLGAIIVGGQASDVEAMRTQLASNRGGPPTIVILAGGDAGISGSLVEGGATDVLLAPVSEAALALGLERILAGSANAVNRKSSGRLIALLKAGGGVGATAIGAQLTAMLAARTERVCYADLDVQFGVAALTLDVNDGMTLSDILRGAGALEDAPLATVLAKHKTGAKILASPKELVPLESISPVDMEGLMKALRRDFAVSLLDLPGNWTAWTHRVLQICDQIILITNLSLPHIHLLKRQLDIITEQGLAAVPLTLVLNRVTEDQQTLVPIKTAEQAIGREFAFVIPEDGKTMNAALAQGLSVSAVRSNAKLEKAIAKLADFIIPAAVSPKKPGRFPWS